jgi:glycerate 2-kinase
MAPDPADRAIRRWFGAAMESVDPERAVIAQLGRDGQSLRVAARSIEVAGRLFVAAIGKAAPAMTRGAWEVVGDLATGGVVITKEGHLNGPIPETVRAFETAHPVPDARCQRATEFLLSELSRLDQGDVVLALISGGGSALMEAPIDGIELAEIAATTDLLLRVGAPIQDLNAVRVPLSKVKGGGLRAAAPGAVFVTLLLSDVLGNDPRVIASGPTLATAFTEAGAIETLARYRLLDSVPSRVIAALNRRADRAVSADFSRDVVTIVGDNRAAVEAFAHAAAVDGIRSRVLLEAATGEARELAVSFVDRVLSADDDMPLYLGGGEATVAVRGDGTGGRNTELALAAALELERRGESGWAVASLASDGQDALTGVAGAVASIDTLRRARAAGVDPAAALEANDSLAVFTAAGGAVETGPTGTNVNDIYIALRMDDPALL